LVECRCGLPESAYDLLLRSAAEAERGDDAAARILQARAVEMIRRIGAVGQLPAALDRLAFSDLLTGRLAAIQDAVATAAGVSATSTSC
jgi:hypothetical protein